MTVDTGKNDNDTPKYPYKPCHIADRGGDVHKRWYVNFYVWDIATQRLKRIQEYGQINDFKTYKDRYREAQRLKKKIDAILAEGYIINSALDPAQYLETTRELKAKEKMTIVQAFEHALKIKLGEVTPSTRKSYTNLVNVFTTYLTDRQMKRAHISQLTPDLVNRFFDYLKSDYKSPRTKDRLTNTSLNNYRTYFRVLINVLRERERLITNDPTTSVPKLKEKTTYHDIYLDDEITKMREYLEANDPHLWLLCQFVYYCFLRPKKEARFLQVKHIKVNNVLAITEDVSKTDTRFPVIPVPLQNALKAWNLDKFPGNYYLFAQGGKPGPAPCYVNYWINKFSRVREILKMSTDKTLYSWKHTGACKLYIATKDVNKVKEQCGHKSLETTLIYLRQLGIFDNKEVENLFPEI